VAAPLGPPPGRLLDVGGTRLHVVERGEGPAVVLLHGNPGSLLHFEPRVVDVLAPRFRVLAFDRPGHGWSDPAPADSGSPIVQARLIHEAVRELGVERAILVAESWSGSLALSFALDFPAETAAIVGLAATFYPDAALIDPTYKLLVAPVVGGLVRNTVGPMLARRRLQVRTAPTFAPLPVPDWYTDLAGRLFTRPSTLLAIARDALRRAQVVKELGARYADVPVPLVLVVGDSDRTADQRGQGHRLREVLPQAELVELSQTGHAIAETRPDRVLEAVERAHALSAR
jgi:pimeloyl-ACP methyl ester carboxylesterase